MTNHDYDHEGDIRPHPGAERPSAGYRESSDPGDIRDGIAQYGDAFIAYLTLEGVEEHSPDLLEQFERRFVGSFPDRDTFTQWAIERTGLEGALTAMRREQGMWDGDLVWDLERMWERMIERYAVTEQLGGVHAFRR